MVNVASVRLSIVYRHSPVSHGSRDSPIYETVARLNAIYLFIFVVVLFIHSKLWSPTDAIRSIFFPALNWPQSAPDNFSSVRCLCCHPLLRSRCTVARTQRHQLRPEFFILFFFFLLLLRFNLLATAHRSFRCHTYNLLAISFWLYRHITF